MAIGTTAALIGFAAASAGTKAAGAIMESKAAGKASKAQQAAANKSTDLYRQIWEGQQAAAKPYQEAGTRSMNLLGSLMVPSGDPASYQVGRPIPGMTPPPGAPPPAPMTPRPFVPGPEAYGYPRNPWMMAYGG